MAAIFESPFASCIETFSLLRCVKSFDLFHQSWDSRIHA
ncbi:hypothetical protein CFter6_1298 [Collimonas fungivorans]|uniref:Uncharacterized protein n=1 Tax=Collimonas fungivorans TaxID=158899 RepID=A0A127P857_9BURK|nr:hypothetical protein CFter6_1298 [Collimonas fungivorans]